MKDADRQHTCCFFGHRKINETDTLKAAVYKAVEDLIIDKSVTTFLFGSKSQFNDFCYKVVTELKKRYCNIKRVYVRAEYAYISDDYKDYLLQFYEETYYPEKMINAGKAAYVERNYEMIDKSDFAIVYYDADYLPLRRKNSRRDLFDYQPKSGTKVAYDYAVKKCERVINVF